MRSLAWIVLLAWIVACGKQGSPMRHPPKPRQARGATVTQPAVPDPAPVPDPTAIDPGTIVDDQDPGAAMETEVTP